MTSPPYLPLIVLLVAGSCFAAHAQTPQPTPHPQNALNPPRLISSAYHAVRIGCVRDELGIPLTGAIIQLIATPSPAPSLSAADGNYMIQVLSEKGKFTVSYEGYTTQTIAYNADPSDDVQLYPSPNSKRPRRPLRIARPQLLPAPTATIQAPAAH